MHAFSNFLPIFQKMCKVLSYYDSTSISGFSSIDACGYWISKIHHIVDLMTFLAMDFDSRLSTTRDP